MSKDPFRPVHFDPDAARRRWSRERKFVEAYTELRDEFEALAELLRARQQAGMTQAQVAATMGVAQSSVARLESAAGRRTQTPSLATLRRYADAVGCELRIRLAPKRARKAKRSVA
jgi:DNA-binding XRE family transcriptional regulator